MKKIFFVLVVLCSNLCARDFFLPWQQDSFTSPWGCTPLRYDKLEHVLFFAGATVCLEQKFGEDHGWKISLALGLVNEIKDGVIDYRRYGKLIGGDGFSFKDLLANVPGITIGHYAKKIIFPVRKRKEKPGWTVNLSFRCQ